MVAAKDYYKVLGIDRKATPEQIKASFRKLARKYHPDTNKSDATAEKRFKEISEAYNVLSDSKKRSEYDNPASQFRNSAGPSAPNPFAGYGGGAGRAGERTEFDIGDFDLGEIFGDRFGGMFRGHGRPGSQTSGPPPPPPVFELPVELDIAEAMSGGKRIVRQDDGRQIEVSFPAGVTTGSKVRAGGHTFVVKLRADPLWRVEGRDVHGDVDVPDYTAALGGEVVAATPTGRISLTVPAGSHSGSVLRLRAKGVPALQDSKAGDLFLHLRVQVPENPSERQKKAYEDLRGASTEAPPA